MAKSATPTALLLPALLQALSRFFAWWGGELASLAPNRLRLWWRGADRIVMLSFDGTRALFAQPAGVRRVEIHAVEVANPDSSLHRGETNRKLVQAAGRNFRLLLCLPPDQVLRRSLTLPLAVEENLRQALTFELDRYTPFRPDQVYFDFRVIERNAAEKRLSVELAVAPKASVDQGVAQAAGLGLSVDGAVLADDLLQSGGDCHDFMRAVAKGRKSPARLWWRAGMATLSVALLAVLLGLPILQKRAAAISLIEPLNEARKAAQDTDARRDRLQKLTEENNFLHNKKWEAYSTLLVLDELTRLLPDDTFVVQVIFDGNTVQLQGDTASSTSLVETLEASPMFKDVSFKSPLTKISGTANDRFHVSATLEAAARPKLASAAPGVTGVATAPDAANVPVAPTGPGTSVPPAAPVSVKPAGKP